MTTLSAGSSGELERFRAVVAARLGLRFDPGRLSELAEALRGRMAVRAVPNVDDYIACIDEDELGALAERLTVGETYFFRYAEQVRAFVDVALPAALGRARRPVRVLSAGCATGEEAYTLAIVAREFRDVVKIQAFDVNPAAIAAARQGRYSSWSLREVPDDVRRHCFLRDGGSYQLAKDVRESVWTERRNLLADDPAFWAEDAFDVVFCRNVLMYFAEDTMATVVERIARAMARGGFLFLGHAETLRGISRQFHLRHSHETFYYERDTAKGGPARNAPRWDLSETERTATAGSGIPVTDTSWVESIRRASERVTRLTAPPPPVPASTQSIAPPPPVARAVLDMIREERFDEALDLLGAPSPSDGRSQMLRAIVLTNASRHREAEEACATVLAHDEFSAGAHYLLALCREHASDFEGARKHDRVAAYLDASFAMPHLHLGLLDRRAGRSEHAAREFQRALELFEGEDGSRILLFGGGFNREALSLLCKREIALCGGLR